MKRVRGCAGFRSGRVLAIFLAFTSFAAAQNVELGLSPQQTAIQYTLDASFHTVHGTFQLKNGDLHFDPATNRLWGAIVVDARSGETGNGSRDRKMHKEVLESEHYPEIAFRPSRVEGTVAMQGKSSVQVHGIFAIHGAEHEVTVPAEIEMFPDRWIATLHFAVPYVQWGMKNPSNFFLRVSESVEVEVSTAGMALRR